MTVDCIRVERKHDPEGHRLGLELAQQLPSPVVDVVAQTIEKGMARGCHYHPASLCKIEIFVPLKGKALLQWHETRDSSLKDEQDMIGIFDNPHADSSFSVFRVNPETCHRVQATQSFLMLSLNNIKYAGKNVDALDCRHGFKCPE